MRELTQARLLEVLCYSPGDGAFVWAANTAITPRVGKPAGTFDGRGYIRIGIDGRIYKAHRLVWLYVYGRWPSGVIDHINGDKADNRLTNLRDTNEVVNAQNKHAANRQNRSQVRGVTLHSQTGRWVARIGFGGKVKHLGMYGSIDEAKAAYLDAKRQLHKGAAL